MVKIWVDADATPKAIREIIIKAASRCQLEACFVANHHLPFNSSPYVKKVQVGAGFDVADNHIVQNCQAGDLVVTQDIPLAAELMAKQVAVINNRGEAYSTETIRQRLNMRDFYETLRASGIQSGGAAAFSDKDKMNFANSFDRWLARQKT